MNRRIVVFLLALTSVASNAAAALLWPIAPDASCAQDLAGRVTQAYGAYQDILIGSTRSKGFHTGVDLSTSGLDCPVRAAQDGILVKRIANGEGDHGFGNTVVLQHFGNDGRRFYTQYSHLSSFEAEVASATLGTTLFNAGAKLGRAGGTGGGDPDRYAVHLHFEVKTFPALCSPAARTCEYGYVSSAPARLGFRNPVLFLNDVDQTFESAVIAVEPQPGIFTGPGPHYSRAPGLTPQEPTPLLQQGKLVALSRVGDWFQIQVPALPRSDGAYAGVLDGWVEIPGNGQATDPASQLNRVLVWPPGSNLNSARVRDQRTEAVAGEVWRGQELVRTDEPVSTESCGGSPDHHWLPVYLPTSGSDGRICSSNTLTAAHGFSRDGTNVEEAIPHGFSPPFNVANDEEELLLKVYRNETDTYAFVGRREETAAFSDRPLYVYRTVKELVNGRWQDRPLSCTGQSWHPVRSWCHGEGVVKLTGDSAYYAAWTCILLPDGQYKCGCRDQACTTPGWHLQKIER